jgi:hypothetical protein
MTATTSRSKPVKGSVPVSEWVAVLELVAVLGLPGVRYSWLAELTKVEAGPGAP